MGNLLVNIVGYAGAAVGTTLMLPQAFKSYKTKSVKDLSWGMVILYFINCALWLAYGLMIHATHVALTNAIAVIISVVQIALKMKFQKNN